jgi:hypothetical protein
MESIKEKPGEPMRAAVIPEVKGNEEKYNIKMDEEHKIGRGQFGYVFKITRKSDDKVLAMKIS